MPWEKSEVISYTLSGATGTLTVLRNPDHTITFEISQPATPQMPARTLAVTLSQDEATELRAGVLFDLWRLPKPPVTESNGSLEDHEF